MAARSTRARWPWIVVAAASVAVAVLCVGSGSLRGTFEGLFRTAPPDSAGTPLSGEATVDGSRPVLEGAARRTAGEHQPAHGPVVVTVLDRDGAPVAGLRVLEGVTTGQAGNRGFQERSGSVTDRLGRARFDDVTYDGSAQVWATARLIGGGAASAGGRMAYFLRSGADGALTLTGPQGGLSGVGVASPVVLDQLGSLFVSISRSPEARASVTGSEVLLRVERGLPIEVEARETDSGHLTSARWQVTPRLEWDSDVSNEASVPPHPDRVEVAVDAPRGWIATAATWEVNSHPQTRRFVGVTPLRPEARLVAVFPPEALPFREEDWQAEISVGGQALAKPDVRLGREGQVTIRGAPHLVGDTVEVGGTLSNRWHVAGQAVMGTDAHQPVLVTVTLSALETEEARELTFNPAVVLGGGVRFTVSGLGRGSMTLEFSSARNPAVEVPVFPTPTGALRVLVRMPGGEPAPGAIVSAGGVNGTTDAAGVVTLEGLPATTVDLLVDGAGAPTRAQAEVRAGGTTPLEVPTGDGGTIDVEVVDALDRPLPFAALAVAQPSGLPWRDRRGEVQRLDPYTDERGRRTLRTVEPGTVKLTATFGSRSASADVEVAEDRSARVRLVLPAHDAPAPTPELPPAR